MPDEPLNILARVSGDQISAASRDFPDAQVANVDVIEGNAVTVDGHKVIVMFRRKVIKHPRKTYYLWSMESARYVDDLSPGRLTAHMAKT